MPLLLKLGEFVFDSRFGKLALAGVVSVLFALSFIAHQRSIGAERAYHKMEQRNAKAADRGKGAAGRSRDERVRGQRDPWTRDDK